MSAKPVRILYRNHRGEVAWRTVLPFMVFWGSSQRHPEPQWLMEAFDDGKGAPRTFAMRDVLEWEYPGAEATEKA